MALPPLPLVAVKHSNLFPMDNVADDKVSDESSHLHLSEDEDDESKFFGKTEDDILEMFVNMENTILENGDEKLEEKLLNDAGDDKKATVTSDKPASDLGKQEDKAKSTLLNSECDEDSKDYKASRISPDASAEPEDDKVDKFVNMENTILENGDEKLEQKLLNDAGKDKKATVPSGKPASDLGKQEDEAKSTLLNSDCDEDSKDYKASNISPDAFAEPYDDKVDKFVNMEHTILENGTEKLEEKLLNDAGDDKKATVPSDKPASDLRMQEDEAKNTFLSSECDKDSKDDSSANDKIPSVVNAAENKVDSNNVDSDKKTCLDSDDRNKQKSYRDGDKGGAASDDSENSASAEDNANEENTNAEILKDQIMDTEDLLQIVAKDTEENHDKDSSGGNSPRSAGKGGSGDTEMECNGTETEKMDYEHEKSKIDKGAVKEDNGVHIEGNIPFRDEFDSELHKEYEKMATDDEDKSGEDEEKSNEAKISETTDTVTVKAKDISLHETSANKNMAMEIAPCDEDSNNESYAKDDAIAVTNDASRSGVTEERLSAEKKETIGEKKVEPATGRIEANAEDNANEEKANAEILKDQIMDTEDLLQIVAKDREENHDKDSSGGNSPRSAGKGGSGDTEMECNGTETEKMDYEHEKSKIDKDAVKEDNGVDIEGNIPFRDEFDSELHKEYEKMATDDEDKSGEDEEKSNEAKISETTETVTVKAKDISLHETGANKNMAMEIAPCDEGSNNETYAKDDAIAVTNDASRSGVTEERLSAEKKYTIGGKNVEPATGRIEANAEDNANEEKANAEILKDQIMDTEDLLQIVAKDREENHDKDSSGANSPRSACKGGSGDTELECNGTEIEKMDYEDEKSKIDKGAVKEDNGVDIEGNIPFRDEFDSELNEEYEKMATDDEDKSGEDEEKSNEVKISETTDTVTVKAKDISLHETSANKNMAMEIAPYDEDSNNESYAKDDAIAVTNDAYRSGVTEERLIAEKEETIGEKNVEPVTARIEGQTNGGLKDGEVVLLVWLVNPVTTIRNTTTVTQSVLQHPAPLPLPPDFQISLPARKAVPPKPNLYIRRFGESMVVYWKMFYNLDNYEAIASYQLYAYQETTSPPSSDMWRRVGVIKALPLPIACTLAPFVDGNTYHFAVRAVDVQKRMGPFSDPVQTPP